jgi:hypothetical protein
MQVFLSVGRVATDRQRLFLDRLEAKLRNRGLDPKTIGRNTFTSGQPLDRIVEVMKGCSGILVLAFERTYVEKGYELRPGDEEPQRFDVRRYASPWHHIELAMAHMLDLPTLAIVERGVCEEGLLEDKYGWYVIRTRLDPSLLDSDECSGIIDDWSNRAKAPRTPQQLDPPPKLEPEKITIGDLVGSMKVAQMWAVIAALLTILAGAFAFGRMWPPTATNPSTTTTGHTQLPLSNTATNPPATMRAAATQETAATTSTVAADGGPANGEAVAAFFSGSFCIQSASVFMRCDFEDRPSCEAVRKKEYPQSYYRCVEKPGTAFCYAFTYDSADRRFYCTSTAASCSSYRQVGTKETNKSQCKQFQL